MQNMNNFELMVAFCIFQNLIPNFSFIWNFYTRFVSKYCVIKMHFIFLMPSSGMHCSSIKKKTQHHQTKIIDVLIFSELVANKGYFWSETTVIFFKKTAKMCILAMLKSNRKMNQICEKLYIK